MLQRHSKVISLYKAPGAMEAFKGNKFTMLTFLAHLIWDIVITFCHHCVLLFQLAFQSFCQNLLQWSLRKRLKWEKLTETEDNNFLRNHWSKWNQNWQFCYLDDTQYYVWFKFHSDIAARPIIYTFWLVEISIIFSVTTCLME